MAKEKVISSQMIFSGKILKLHVDTVSSTGGVKKTREIIDHSEAMVAVPVDAKGYILLVEQYRLPTRKALLELPAGGIEPGEDVEEAVRRELQEEIGYSPKTVMRMTGFYSAPGYSNEFLHLYLATDLVPARLTAEDTDEIKVIPTAVDKIPELITSGKICDAKTIAGLLFYLKFCKP
ncbi:MAG: NUDIX hydrolase [Dehalococcoidales bacterium]|nr:NUDIX hydrolase [Dehalococcoidales bacterium]